MPAKGYKMSKVHRQKLSEAHKGKNFQQNIVERLA